METIAKAEQISRTNATQLNLAGEVEVRRIGRWRERLQVGPERGESARLRRLRAKLGCNLEDLRQYSAHFEKMEELLSDPRARRLYRKGAAYGEEEEGGG